MIHRFAFFVLQVDTEIKQYKPHKQNSVFFFDSGAGGEVQIQKNPFVLLDSEGGGGPRRTHYNLMFSIVYINCKEEEPLYFNIKQFI